MKVNSRRARAVVCAVVTAASMLWAATGVAAPAPPKVLNALRADDDRVRVAAVVALTKSRADNARQLLEAVAAGDPAAVVRAAAVEGLGRLGDPLALPAARAALDDEAELVQRAARKVIVVLERAAKQHPRRGRDPGADGSTTPQGLSVTVDVSNVEDLSSAGIPGLAARLQQRLLEELKRDRRRPWDVQSSPQTSGYGLLARNRSVTPFQDEGMEGLEVHCDVTVVQLPSKSIRLSLRAAAAAGVDGELGDDMRSSLAADGVDACAPALAKDFLDYAVERAGR
ncbi:MAG: HEAT repeat domain-containing protein [Myxococcota bacterium]